MRQNEYGQTLYVATDLDISTATNINLFVTRPHLNTVKTIADGVTIGLVNLTVGDIDYAAGFYVSYIIQNGDINQSGKYKVRLEADVGGVHYVSSTACFTVGKQNDACPCP